MSSIKAFVNVPITELGASLQKVSLYSVKILPNIYEWTDDRSLFVSHATPEKTCTPTWTHRLTGAPALKFAPGCHGVTLYIVEHSSNWYGSSSTSAFGYAFAPMTQLLNETSIDLQVYEYTYDTRKHAQVGTIRLGVGEPNAFFTPVAPPRTKVPTFLQTFGKLMTAVEGMRSFHFSQTATYRLSCAVGNLTRSFLTTYYASSEECSSTDNPCHDILSQSTLLANYVRDHYQSSSETRQLSADFIKVLARALAIMFALAKNFTKMTYRNLRDSRLDDEVQKCQDMFLQLYSKMIRDVLGIPPFGPQFDEDLCTRAVETFMHQSKETQLSGPYTAILEIVRGPSARSMQELFLEMVERSTRTTDRQGPARRDACRRLISFIARTAIVLPLALMIKTAVTRVDQGLASSLPNADEDEKKSDFNVVDDPEEVYGEYPTGVVSSVKYSRKSAIKSGSQGQVYKAEMATGQHERMVAVAVKEIHGNVERDSLQQVYLEIVIAFTLCHPRVIRMHGVVDSSVGLKLIFPWYGNSDTLTYLWSLHDMGGRRRFVRKINQLLCQVAEGLVYMQEEMVVHGDLSSRNILVDDYGNAVIADLGLSTYTNALSKQNQSSRADNTRWLAPELANASMKPNGERMTGRPTPQSDLFAFAMVCIELYSGYPPYKHIPSQATVHEILSQGDRPNFPPMLQDQDLEHVIERCWDPAPSRRGTASELLRDMRHIYSRSG